MGAQYRPEVAEIFPRTRAGNRLGNADNCIPPPLRSHSWWKSSVHGGNGVWGCGGRIPAEINSERRGIHRLSPPSPRKPFSSNYFANIAKRSRQASSSSHVFRLTRAFLYAIRPFFFLLIYIFISSRQIFVRNFHHLLRTFLSKFGYRFRSPRENRKTMLKDHRDSNLFPFWREEEVARTLRAILSFLNNNRMR